MVTCTQDGEPRKSSSCFVVAIGVCACVVLLVLALSMRVFLYMRSGARAEKNFLALCHGDPDIRIVRLELEGQFEHAIIQDRESLDFLARAFTTTSPEGTFENGTGVYEVRISFASGESIKVRIWIAYDLNGPNGMEVGFVQVGFMDEEFWYHVEFPDPPRGEIKRILEHLVEKDRDLQAARANQFPEMTPPLSGADDADIGVPQELKAIEK